MGRIKGLCGFRKHPAGYFPGIRQRTTLFYWTKWLGTLVAVHHHSERLNNVTKKSEWTSLISLSVLMVTLCLTFPLVSTYLIEPFLMEMYHQYVPTLSEPATCTS